MTARLLPRLAQVFVAALVAALVALAASVAGALEVADAQLERRPAADPAAVVGSLGAGPTWLAWTVPGTAAGTEVCCFRGRDWRARGCRLDRREGGWGTSRDWPRAGRAAGLVVLVELDGRRPRWLRAVGDACPIDGAGHRLLALDGVAPARSLDLLERWARDEATVDDVRESALAAIGYHADAGAAKRFEALALDRGLGEELRQNALFWAGQTLGAAALPIVERFLAGAEPSLRDHAYFVLSQTGDPAASARLRRAAREDPAAEQRGQALFWLAQSGAPEAAAWILEALDAERSAHAREQAVFALSQLDDGVPYLLRLLRETPHPEVRRQALFWLAQSDDPRALAELERILE